MRDSRRALRAILYDIHGNLPALEAVLAEAGDAGVRGYVLGGDYISPLVDLSRATLRRLRELEDAVWIRGNGERWLVEPPTERPEVADSFRALAEDLADEVDWLYALPTQAEREGILFCHGSPLADDESFGASEREGDEQMLAGVRDRTVVFGHSHLQFRRPGPHGTELVNPGSVGMPLDGDTRAAWALLNDGGELEFRRTAYDADAVAAAYRALGDWLGELMAARIERGSD